MLKKVGRFQKIVDFEAKKHALEIFLLTQNIRKYIQSSYNMPWKVNLNLLGLFQPLFLSKDIKIKPSKVS